ncbi:coagulation factor V [Betta splendens]|uniref:ferroxidase n=1 Tax=Betta splendens TaxID=158456 RepID=A0A6P7LG10_BETSP|nr:coagulation factor V [Betta splendens]
MRLCVWTGARRVLPVLLLLAVIRVQAQQPKERHYYIAAVEIDWTYSDGENGFGSTYKKVVFREYEKGFKQAKTHPSWLGLLGPTLRAQEGETLVVTFRNMASGAHSLHPHGVTYGKQSEGAQYFDNTSQKEKEDDVVQPNTEHVYSWEVTSQVAPQPDDPACLTYTYISHENVVEDYNSGLVGALLICKAGSLDASGQQVGVHHEYVFLFGVFNEKESKHKANGAAADKHVKYTINGFTKGSLPDVRMCANAWVSLHLLAMSSEPDVFSVHVNGQVLQQSGHKVSSVGLVSGSCATASMKALYAGRWMLSSHTSRHLEAGMHGFVDVKQCDGFEASQREMTSEQKKHSKVWKYYIAAEEVIWDYAPQIHGHVDEDFKQQYLKQSATRIGSKYKKALYVCYTNESFTERCTDEDKQRKSPLGIVGPVIRAQVRDAVVIVFKNKASRPYSIYPHGLTIEKSEEGVNHPQAGNQTQGVDPGQVRTYVWRVVEEDEPLDQDARCQTRMYHSAVDTPRDIASGLIGPMLICRSESLNVRNVQLKADKEQHAMFAVFDENRSWYLDSNIRQYSDESKVNKADPDFYKSNVMHTINGYAFESGPLLGFCNGEVATWHVSSVGAQDYIQTATFYGHPFTLNERMEDVLSLYPMTGETITMNMDNPGVWLLASLNSLGTTKGMRVKFQDVECFRDSFYDYTEEDDHDQASQKEYSTWNPESLDDIKKKEEQLKAVKGKLAEPDEYTDMFAAELGLRSLRNQSTVSDADKLDLTFLDYDSKKSKNRLRERNGNAAKTSAANVNMRNKALLTNWIEVEKVTEAPGVNLTGDDLLSKNIIAPALSFNNYSDYERGNETLFSNRTEAEATNLNQSFSKSLVSSSSLHPANNFVLERAGVSDDSLLDNVGTNTTKGNGTTATGNLTKQSTAAKAPGNVTWTSDVEGSNGSVSGDDLETVTRGDVFSVVSLSQKQDGNKTQADYDDTSSDAAHPGLDSAELNLSSNNTHNFTAFDVETTDNRTRDKELENRAEAGSSEASPAAAQSSHCLTELSPESREDGTQQRNDNHTESVGRTQLNHNHTKSVERTQFNPTECVGRTQLNHTQSVGRTQLNHNHTESVEGTQLNHNHTQSVGRTQFNHTECVEGPQLNQNLTQSLKGTQLNQNHTQSVQTVPNDNTTTVDASVSSSADHVTSSDSSEEVIIYLKETNTDGIKSTVVKTQSHNWTYDESQPAEPVDIPDHMRKYFEDKSPQKPPPPRNKRVFVRHRPEKGQGLKTKKRKDYKPQARSLLPFSPRGFNPGLSPRGARPSAPRPVSDEEELINTPVVIGVPRFGFSDYDLYVPGSKPDPTDLEEYEYVSYKDPYGGHEDMKKLSLDETAKYYLKYPGLNVKTYFIAAEEVEWDYAGYGQRRQEKSHQTSRETTIFTKVVFRGYVDSSFSTPEIRGEVEEHLGILGPVIRAEVGQSIVVVFRNNAKRPFSLHPNGVTYTKQTEGLSYEDGSTYWFQYDNEVQPNSTFTYLWKASLSAGPTRDESNCRTWAYYSGVNPERDIHSGLIGPLLVCRKGTLDRSLTDTREFVLLFMTFDESQSWYYEKNQEMIQRKTRRRNMDPSFDRSLKFHSINGIIFNLKGLRMYTEQQVSWHLLNMGSPTDLQSIHFHGQTFVHKTRSSSRQAVHPLLPGSFSTLEMHPSKPGLWQLETEVGSNQQNGMQTLFLVLDNDCYRPLGLESGMVKDDQISAINTRGNWEPQLARLNNQGRYNAWSTEMNHSWIQVDFQRPVVISQVATQGAKQLLQHQHLRRFSVSYSTDRRMWIFYKGDSRGPRKEFSGNLGSYDIKMNTFFPPIIGRYIRLHPIDWSNKATVRMEFYGCELDGCSLPLGMESGLIEDQHISASSTASSWYGSSWKPSLARLNRQGAINAWQAKHNDMFQWLQVELPKVMKITGIITQGAKALGREMYVTSYSLQYSNDGLHWSHYTDDENVPFKTFLGNRNNSDHVKNYIYPPIFSRFLRIVPRTWMVSLTLRVELLGCDFE